MASSMRPIQPDHNRTDINGMPHIPINTNATPTIFERHTKSGRHLRYKLTILQQPERARACGSGSKSAADRRPVDPPPVVELLIFDVCNGQEKDITFSYNVNFFLFATLEHARPMVHGRVQTPSATSPPVLTGMPVSGMAYLDRPSVAGYFLFPDLSVRHEGRYRLAFNLYEEIKEAGDADLEPAEKSSDVNDNPAFDWRMEIKSNPFTVYSAKKFPGLTESTLLSRTVADQGCRVRIRRDVRMRRRETKGDSGRSSNRERRAVEQRIPRTPDRQPVEQYRARSGSSHSVHSDHGRVPAPMVPSMPHSMPPSMPQSYQSEPKRKISISESYQAPPLPPNHSNSAPSASYNGPSAPYSYASSTPSHHAPPPPPPQSPSHNYPSSYNPPYPSYSGSSRPVSQSYDRHNSVSTSYTPMEVDPKHDRRPSVSHPVTPSPSTHYPSEYEKLDRRPSFAVPPTPSYKDNNNFRLPPLRDLAPTSQVMPDIPPTQPPPASSKYINAHIEPDTEPESPIRLPSLAINSGNKRTRDPSPSDSCRYFNGARQETGTTPSYTPNPYLSSRQDPSYYMHSHPSHPDSLEWMSAEGYSKSLPQNRFY